MAAPGKESSDEDLMAACAQGDRDAFDLLMRRHADGLISFLRGLACRIDAALDIAQEAFLAVWRSRARYEPRARFRTWLYAIARNQYASWVRQQSRRPRGAPARREAPSPDADLERRESIATAIQLLENLPEVEREVLVLRVLQEMPYGEISELLGLPENALRAYASRALARLREALR